jgi:hypothetical protein
MFVGFSSSDSFLPPLEKNAGKMPALPVWLGGTFAVRTDMLVFGRGIQPSRDVSIVHAHAPFAPTFGS